MKYEIVDARIIPEKHMVPSSDGANSIDLRACITEPLTLQPGQEAIVSCGFKVALPYESMGMLLPRSGKGIKGLVLGNLVGNIDPDYRGEVKAALWNRGTVTHVIQPMERIAQFVVVSTFAPVWIEEAHLPDTDRGDSGFGSTGSE